MWAALGWVALGLEIALAVAGIVWALVLGLRRQDSPWPWVLLLVAANFPWGILLGWPQGWVLTALNTTTKGNIPPLAGRGVEFVFGFAGNLPLFAGLALGLTTLARPAPKRRRR